MKNKSLWILFLLLFLLIYIYCSFYRASFFAMRAEYYFKRNNIEQAQTCYEKAFELGLDSSREREKYVNSIINSPLTISAQEKLVKFLTNSKNDNAFKKAEKFVYEIQREINRKYPENFILNTVYDQKVMRWADRLVTYKFDYDAKFPAYFIKEFENAFIELEKVTDHEIIFAYDEENPNIVIKFEEENIVPIKASKYVAAYTTPILDLNKLERMEIVFYLKNYQGKYVSKNQVYNNALHEIYHALGFMGHSEDRDSLMYLSSDVYVGKNVARKSLTVGDINTLKLLYKIKPQITNEIDAKADYIPYFVLGAKEEINSEKIKEAKRYIITAPNLPAGYIDLAEAYIAEKDYQNAIKNLKKAANLENTDDIQAMIYYNLAVTYFYMDDLLSSKEYLKKSIEIEETEDKIYLLAEIYMHEGDTAKALNEYLKLLNSEPHNIRYVVAVVNIHILNRDFIKARKVLKTYFKNNPTEKNNPIFKSYGILKIFL